MVHTSILVGLRAPALSSLNLRGGDTDVCLPGKKYIYESGHYGLVSKLKVFFGLRYLKISYTVASETGKLQAVTKRRQH